MLLGILNNLLGHYLPLESTQRAFDRFSGINCNYCHLYLHLRISNSNRTSYLTRPAAMRSSEHKTTLRFCYSSFAGSRVSTTIKRWSPPLLSRGLTP